MADGRRSIEFLRIREGALSNLPDIRQQSIIAIPRSGISRSRSEDGNASGRGNTNASGIPSIRGMSLAATSTVVGRYRYS